MIGSDLIEWTVALVLSIVSPSRMALSEFRSSESGNIAVIFTVALVPLLSFVGAAIDYTRVNAGRCSMQAGEAFFPRHVRAVRISHSP